MVRVAVIKVPAPVVVPGGTITGAEWTAVRNNVPGAAATPRRIVRVNSAGTPYFAPAGDFAAEDFGAIADGTTDNATAFASLSAAVNAVPNGDGTPVIVRFAGNADGLAYRYSGGLGFDRPVLLQGSAGATLDYTGSGYAVRFGPSGLVYADVELHRHYGARDLTVTGGLTMTHGLYFSTFVTEPRLRGVRFVDFGTSGGYGVFCQSDNWDIAIEDCDFLSTPGVSQKRNWVRVNGYTVGGTSDNGQSRLRLSRCHATVQNGGGGIGVYVNGMYADIGGNKIEGFSPNVWLGGWSTGTRIHHNYFESVRNVDTDSCLTFGDPASGYAPSLWPGGFVIESNYVNCHNVDMGLATYVLGPATATVGLQNTRLAHNALAEYDPARPMVGLNDLASQVGNEATNNSGAAILHTSGAAISRWRDERIPATGLGALVGVREVFDGAGTSLGYVPVYASYS